MVSKVKTDWHVGKQEKKIQNIWAYIIVFWIAKQSMSYWLLSWQVFRLKYVTGSPNSHSSTQPDHVFQIAVRTLKHTFWHRGSFSFELLCSYLALPFVANFGIHYRANISYLLEKDMNKNMNFAKLFTFPVSKQNVCWVFFFPLFFFLKSLKPWSPSYNYQTTEFQAIPNINYAAADQPFRTVLLYQVEVTKRCH